MTQHVLTSAHSIKTVFDRSTDEKTKHIGVTSAFWTLRTSLLRFVWLSYTTNRFTGERESTPRQYVVDDFGDLMPIKYIHRSVVDVAPGVCNPH